MTQSMQDALTKVKGDIKVKITTSPGVVVDLEANDLALAKQVVEGAVNLQKLTRWKMIGELLLVAAATALTGAGAYAALSSAMGKGEQK